MDSLRVSLPRWTIVLLCAFLFPLASAVCPNGCTCDDEKLVVTCIESNLDVIPITLNPSIQRLVLKSNRIKTVDAAFQFYGELLHVDLSDNQLVYMPAKSFEAQRKLVELHLGKNKVSSLTNKTFAGLKSLTVLNLRENYLSEVSERLFGYLPRLQELDLGSNSINVIHPAAFAGLSELRVLYLDDNQLQAIPAAPLSVVPNLAELRVGMNQFQHLPDRSFGGLQKLVSLDISGSGLVNISHRAFQGVESLRVLKLVDNSLQDVPSQSLAQLPRLEELHLGQNNFLTLPARAFQGLPRLRHIDVSGAPFLNTVDVDAFTANKDLDTIELNSNKRLISLPEGVFMGLLHLRYLSLRDNAFVTVSSTLLGGAELKMVDLRENPLECICALLWLRDMATRNMSQATCSSPPELHGRPLHQVTPEDLSCAMHDSKQQAIIGIICACALGLLVLLLILLYRYRKRFQNALKDYKWNNHSLGGKEHEYQKTLGDEDYIVRAAYNQQQTLKPIPVTEL